MKTIYIILIIIASVLLLFFIVSLFIIYRAFIAQFTNKYYDVNKLMKFPKGTIYEKYTELIEGYHKLIDTLPKVEINTTSFDGLKLVADYFPNTKNKKFILFFHGYLSMPRNDFGSFNEYYSRGYSVVSCNQRAHDRSEGKYTTFGARERFDVVSWCNELVKRYGDDIEIMLAGVSLGGATVMMSSNLDLPKQVKGIISDCGFVSCKQIISSVIKHRHIPLVKYIMFVLGIYTKMFGHFSITEGDSSKALSESNIPILLIHGRGDDFVPCECSEVCYKNCHQEIHELYLTDSKVHGASYFYDREEYVKTVLGFFEKVGF